MKLYFKSAKLTGSLFLLVVLFFVAGCKKDHATQNQTATNSLPVSMTHIESYGTANLSFTYNPDSTLKVISSSGYEFEPSLTIIYQPHTLLIRRQLSATNSPFELDSISLNTSGHIINIRQFYDPEKTLWNNDQYTLNTNNEVIQMERGVSTSQKTTKFSFIYINGNLIHDATAATYLYDLTKPAQFGDRHSLMNFLTYGLKYPLSKNLVTGAVYGTDTTFYRYNYDQAGRIIEYHQEQNGKTYTQYKISYQ